MPGWRVSPDANPLPTSLTALSKNGARLCLDVRRFLLEAARLSDADSLTPASASPAAPAPVPAPLPATAPPAASVSALSAVPETPLLRPGEGVIVGFSGGPDSTALALILRCLGHLPVLVHLDHALRPESAAEACHALRFAAALGVPCHVQRCEVAALARDKKQGLEEAGRMARYALLEEQRRARGLRWIATGHHLDDLSEDVLLRLVRGAGWPAVAGMAALVPERHLLRPLLFCRKARLVAWLSEEGIACAEDASNADPAFRRNRLRHRVLPLLEAENPSFVDNLRQLWALARHDERHWQTLLAAPLTEAQRTDRGWRLPRTALQGLSSAARLRLYMALIRRCEQGQGAASVLLALDSALTRRDRGTGKRFQLPGGLEIRLEHDALIFTIP